MLNSLTHFLFALNSFISIICLPFTIISLIIVLAYYLYFFSKLSLHKSKSTFFNEPISIIVCAKNELVNLKANVPKLLSQNYSHFELIIVNDQSNDGSNIYLDELAKKYDKLVIVNIDDFVTHPPGKKFALTLGIKTAKYEYLLLTDADCAPSSDEWATQMCNSFKNTDIILGYGGYKKQKGFLNKLIRFDTFNVAQQYFSYALKGQTYMGVGRNLAYKKSLFFDNKGFANHMHIASGDDDLFIQEVASADNISIELSESAHTTSVVINKWGEWVHQKRRHISTAPHYKFKFKVLLALYAYAQLSFWLSIILLFSFKINVLFIGALLTVKLLVSYLVNYRSMKHLKVADLYLLHPFYEIAHLLMQGIFVLLNLFNIPKKWSR